MIICYFTSRLNGREARNLRMFAMIHAIWGTPNILAVNLSCKNHFLILSKCHLLRGTNMNTQYPCWFRAELRYERKYRALHIHLVFRSSGRTEIVLCYFAMVDTFSRKNRMTNLVFSKAETLPIQWKENKRLIAFFDKYYELSVFMEMLRFRASWYEYKCVPFWFNGQSSRQNSFRIPEMFPLLFDHNLLWLSSAERCDRPDTTVWIRQTYYIFSLIKLYFLLLFFSLHQT